MRKLTVTRGAFTAMLSDLIASGVTFNATETVLGNIEIIFTGGY